MLFDFFACAQTRKVNFITFIGLLFLSRVVAFDCVFFCGTFARIRLNGSSMNKPYREPTLLLIIPSGAEALFFHRPLRVRTLLASSYLTYLEKVTRDDCEEGRGLISPISANLNNARAVRVPVPVFGRSRNRQLAPFEVKVHFFLTPPAPRTLGVKTRVRGACFLSRHTDGAGSC